MDGAQPPQPIKNTVRLDGFFIGFGCVGERQRIVGSVSDSERRRQAVPQGRGALPRAISHPSQQRSVLLGGFLMGRGALDKRQRMRWFGERSERRL